MNKKLVPPCAYQGGKQRIAKDIIDIILKDNPFLIEEENDIKFYDLCCGSGAISIEMINRGVSPNNIVMVDASPWGLFYQMLGNDTFSPDVFKIYIDDIPKDITKIKNYAYRMTQQKANDGLFNNMVYKFLILQACAFGSTATWVENNQWKKAGGLRNYWLPTETSNRKSPVNPMMPMPDTLFKRVEELYCKMEYIKGYYDDVNNIKIEERAILYIDPPYDKTTKYGFKFDYMDFIEKYNDTNIIYLSEGKKLSDKAFKISSGRNKGGINGERKNENEEWLNVFIP